MALEGTLKDFALPDILQLIGIQRKTGVLTMENGQDKVTVQFHQGNVVGADNSSRQIEECLGTVLVRTGRISDVQLKEALAIQKETLQRLGYILVKSGYLTEGELREALRMQISQIVYRLFRWRDGRYHFLALDHLEYDRNLTIPVSAESLLMEAARMVDEWPILERRIKSPKLVFRKTPAGVEHERSLAPAVGDDVEFALDLLDGPSPSEKAAEIPPEEREVLTGLDGKATVEAIVDRSAFGEFDVYRVLHDLLQRGLVEEVQVAAPKAPAESATGVSSWRTWAAVAVLGLLSVLAVAPAKLNPAAPWRVGALGREQNDLRAYVSRARLERLEQAIQSYFVRTASLPSALPDLVREGYLKREDVRDPWGRPYGYEANEGGFRLAGWDAQGAEDPTLELTHPLSPAQRALLEGPAQQNAQNP